MRPPLALRAITVNLRVEGQQEDGSRHFRPLVADIRDAVLNGPQRARRQKSAGDNSGASDSDRLDLYLKVICSSNNSLVGAVHRNSNKSVLLPPPLVELQKLADLTPNSSVSAKPVEQVSRSLRQRLEPVLIKQIVAQYEAGATTPSLCESYRLSKTSILRVLRDEGAALRRQPLTDDQVEVARTLYEHGHPIAAIATPLDTSYNNVRQHLIKVGVQLRPRGGSHQYPTCWSFRGWSPNECDVPLFLLRRRIQAIC